MYDHASREHQGTVLIGFRKGDVMEMVKSRDDGWCKVRGPVRLALDSGARVLAATAPGPSSRWSHPPRHCTVIRLSKAASLAGRRRPTSSRWRRLTRPTAARARPRRPTRPSLAPRLCCSAAAPCRRRLRSTRRPSSLRRHSCRRTRRCCPRARRLSLATASLPSCPTRW